MARATTARRKALPPPPERVGGLPPFPSNLPTLGWQVVEWGEEMLCHGPGDVEGDRIELADEDVLFLLWAYALNPKGHPRAGRRIFQRATLSRPKGWAKSEDAGFIVCAEFLGPVRFGGWDARGQPVGVPIRSPFIRCLATEEDQAGNTYDNVHSMLTRGRAADEYDIDVGLTRTFLRELGGGEIRPSTSGAASKDGGKESFAVADEVHLYVLPELRQMHRTVARNARKRKAADGWMLDTTTMYAPGEDSIAERQRDAFDERGWDGSVRAGILYDHAEAPPIKDWSDDRELLQALRSVFGPERSKWMDLEGILAADIRSPDAEEHDSRRYWFNQVTTATRQWMSKPEVTARRVPKPARRLKRNEKVTLGFDGSRTKDSTGLVACTRDGYLKTLAVWERPSNPRLAKGWRVPEDEVLEEVAAAFSNLTIVRFYPDPPWWEAEVDAWISEYGKEIVRPFYTQAERKMAAAVGSFRTQFRLGEITHDGHPDLERHLLNAQRRKIRSRGDDEPDAYVIEKDAQGSPRKIDLAVCSILAVEARGDAIANGEFDMRRPVRGTGRLVRKPRRR